MSINDVIRQVQNKIREQSGYHPDNASLLPEVADLIADLDPSPAYLRCKRCKGRFLNGLQSFFCVYCGAERHDLDLPPDPIKFDSTVAYRWLLDALKLDGSEIVGKGTDENESDRGQASPKKEILVSELLDLEIRWPARPNKMVEKEIDTGNHSSPNKSLGNLHLEKNFPLSKSDAAGTSQNPGSPGQNESSETIAVQSRVDVDLFENFECTEANRQHELDNTGNDFSGLQVATSVFPQNELCSFDSFGVSSSNLSSQIDSMFGSEKNSKVEKSTLSPADPSLSNNDLNGDYLWTNFSSGVSEQSKKLEASKLEIQDGSRKLDSYENEDWGLGDQWQTGRGKVSDSVTVDEDDDSYDAWNDFPTSSSKPLQQYDGSSVPMPSGSHASEIDLFSSNNLQDNDFGDFNQPALFSSSLQSSSMGLNHLQPESTFDDRMHGANFKTVELNGEFKSIDYVETLMSQMHDLSFMLEDDLSIPKTISDSSH